MAPCLWLGERFLKLSIYFYYSLITSPRKKRYCHFEQSRVPHINAYFMLSLLNIGPVVLKNNIFKSRQSTSYFVMIFPGNFENLEFPSPVRMLALCHICWNWSNTWFMRRCRKCEMFTIRRPNYEQHAVRKIPSKPIHMS